MNPKAEKFFDAITLLREDLVEDAQNYVFRKKVRVWKKIGSLAACMALVASLGLLAALPKGCGSSGGTDMITNEAPPPAPAEMPPSSSEPSSDGTAGANTDTIPRPPEGEEQPEMGGPVRFSGQVLEVLEDELLVEPFDTLSGNPSMVHIPTAGMENLPEFYPGGVVMVTCRQFVFVYDAAVAVGVTELDLVEPETP